jgi:hypothetical protein
MRVRSNLPNPHAHPLRLPAIRGTPPPSPRQGRHAQRGNSARLFRRPRGEALAQLRTASGAFTKTKRPHLTDVLPSWEEFNPHPTRRTSTRTRRTATTTNKSRAARAHPPAHSPTTMKPIPAARTPGRTRPVASATRAKPALAAQLDAARTQTRRKPRGVSHCPGPAGPRLVRLGRTRPPTHILSLCSMVCPRLRSRIARHIVTLAPVPPCIPTTTCQAFTQSQLATSDSYADTAYRVVEGNWTFPYGRLFVYLGRNGTVITISRSLFRNDWSSVLSGKSLRLQLLLAPITPNGGADEPAARRSARRTPPVCQRLVPAAAHSWRIPERNMHALLPPNSPRPARKKGLPVFRAFATPVLAVARRTSHSAQPTQLMIFE